MDRAQTLLNLKTPVGRKRAAIIGSVSVAAIVALYTWSRKTTKPNNDKYKPIPYKDSRGLWNLLSGEWRETILPDMDEAHKTLGPIYQTGNSVMRTVSIADPELIKDVARQPHSLGPNAADTMELMMPGAIQSKDERLWAKRRKALVHGLRICHLGTLVPQFIEFFGKAVDDGTIRSNNVMDFGKILRSFVFESFGRISFGRQVELGEFPESFKIWNAEFIWRMVLRKKFLYTFPCPRYWRFQKAEAYMKSRVAEVRNAPENVDCVLSRVLEYSNSRETEEEKLDEQEIFDLILMVFLAGYDTTANALGFTMHCLAANPEKQQELYRQLVEHGLPPPTERMSAEVLEKVVRECKYLEYVTNEGMRHYPVGLGTARTAMEDVEIGPYLVEKGTSVLGNFWQLRFDPKIWGTEFDPRAFVPERWAALDKDLVTRNSFFPFGVGARDCPGQRFAVLEMRIVVALFLQRFVLRSVPGKEPEIYFGTVITSKDGFWFDLEDRV